ncbi:hypothetical protein HXX76_013029 [Chlamydomonas incerta]|uniref:Uncharacterized protein n=1 Tax=Chlamydomonas incerta TaxID=51695 RepID=A0A835SJT9_CHLIN|nr:hypothetical protein HXX76_013029 [Chlamydomonas incerta]|eukprot:KAG2426272.1 hypothetical protein HXX76_013029 [Chlamydomonas incerta]
MDRDTALHPLRADQRPAAAAAAAASKAKTSQGQHRHYSSPPDTAAPADQPPPPLVPVPGVYTALSPRSPTRSSAFAAEAQGAASSSADPGRPASPVSFPLTGPLSGANSTRTSYRSLLDTADAAQIDAAAAAAFAQQPAVPEDDVLPLHEGVPLPVQPPPKQPARAPTVAPAAAPAVAAPSRHQEPDVYGLYDPSGAIDYLSQQEEQHPEQPAADLSAAADALGITTQAAPDDVAALAVGTAFVLSSAAAADPAAELQQAATVAAAAADAAAAGFPATAALILSSLTDQVDLALSTAAAAPALAPLPHTGSSSSSSPPEDTLSAAPQQPQPLSSEPTPAFNSPRATQAPYPDTTAMATGTTTATAAPGTDFRSALTGGGSADGAVKHTLSPAAPVHTPAGSSALQAAEWRDYGTLPQRYKYTVDGLRSLAAARFMEEHWDAARHLDVEVTWDVPPIYLQGREAMRVAVWLAKWAATVEVTPAMVKYAELDSKRTALELYLTAAVSPHRPWWLPATWLLPRSLPLQATVKLRISKGPAPDGSDDVVTCIDGALHNAPKLPTPIRILNAVALGYLPAATEPLWAPFVALFGDPSYRNRAEEHPSLLTRAADTAADAATSAAEGAADAAARAAAGAASAADRGAGAVAYGAERVAGDRGGVVGAVKGGVVAGAGAVKGAVQEVVGAVEGGVAAGAEFVKEGAEAARRAVKGGGR